MKDKAYDQLLKINTIEDQKKDDSSIHYHRYESTPFYGLDTLFSHYALHHTDCFVDFGCGKGRSLFYCHYFFQTTVTGIEMNKALYEEAIENKRNYIKHHNRNSNDVLLKQTLAENYVIHSFDNKFYFFNPFSVNIFIKVVNNIIKSVENNEREVDIILYYPSKEYIFFLEYQTAFRLVKEVVIPGDYERNQNERFLIYRFSLEAPNDIA